MKPIEVGDTVWVATGMPCCGHPTGAEGKFFIVKSIKANYAAEPCGFCNVPYDGPAARGLQWTGAIDFPRLRKVPPIAESTEEQREVVKLNHVEL